MPTFMIEPMNEPRGEGNGWEPCEEHSATCFAVVCLDRDEIWAAPDTRPQAEAFINRREWE
jgi:hypothetical protein